MKSHVDLPYSIPAGLVRRDWRSKSGDDAQTAEILDRLEGCHFADESLISRIVLGSHKYDHKTDVLREDELVQDLQEAALERNQCRVYFVDSSMMPGSHRWKMSRNSLRQLALHLQLPHEILEAFAANLVRSPVAMRKIEPAYSMRAYDQTVHNYLILPFPVLLDSPTLARDEQDGNLTGHLRLITSPEALKEVCAVLHVRRDTQRRSASFLVVNLPEEYHDELIRIVETHFQQWARNISSSISRFPPHLAAHSMMSILPFWKSALDDIDEQLQVYEWILHREFNNPQDIPISSSYASCETLRQHLYTLGAHLRRYTAELSPILELAHGQGVDFPESFFPEQLQPLHDKVADLRAKATAVLNLVLNRIQVLSDRQMVANGAAMQAALRAMQAEARLGRHLARQSQALAREMKRDSVAMRTIAVVTLGFLPAATFAALLSMPFFEQDGWFARVGRIWLWAVLTAPTTLGAYAFYYYVQRRDDQRQMGFEMDGMELEEEEQLEESASESKKQR